MTSAFDSFLMFIEGLFTTHAPEIVAAAATSPAVQTAIEQAAVASAVQDPKVQAGIAVFQAVKNYNAVAANQPAPTVTPVVPPEAV